jgi:hypothetical protein
LLVEATWTDYDGDGIADYLTRVTRAYDVHNNVLTAVFDFDYNGDGIVDRRETITLTY